MKRQPPKMPVVEVKKPGTLGLRQRIAVTLPPSSQPAVASAKPALVPAPPVVAQTKKEPPIKKAKPATAVAPPQASKKKAAPSNPPKTSFFYQALGWIVAPVGHDEGASSYDYYFTAGGRRYPLVASDPGIKQLRRVARGDVSQPLCLRVYPRWFITFQGVLAQKFQLVGCRRPKPEDENRSGLFHLRGVWKKLPDYPVPVLAIYRNAPSSDEEKQPYLVRHVPVSMQRSDGPEPFVVVRGMPKDEDGPKWFIQGEFTFEPEQGLWRWVRDLEPPTCELPPKVHRRRKVFKEKAAQETAPLSS